MRIRFPFAAAFLVILVLAGFGGLLPHSKLPATPQAPFAQSDKVLHFLTFFALTAAFYFILDTSRRRVLHLTLLICTVGLGIGAEILQGLLPNDRDFDAFDVLANVVGSLCALGLAGLYHKRAAERRRKAKYTALQSTVPAGEADLELGEAIGARRDDTEDSMGPPPPPTQNPAKTVEQEVDNWDENAIDEAWDDEDDGTTAESGAKMTPASSSTGEEDAIKTLAVD